MEQGPVGLGENSFPLAEHLLDIRLDCVNDYLVLSDSVKVPGRAFTS